MKRFCVRRGKAATLNFDNIVNVKSASIELNTFKKVLKTPYDELSNFLAEEFITWKLPRSP